MKNLRLGCILAVFSLSACLSNFGVEGFKFSKFTALFKSENKPIYKVGQPYKIDGVTYYPKEDYKYSEIGLASWYGEDFHGSLTANGEVYDMNALTAAHKTLPMPSFVRVTNMLNGKNLVLRVNDRGPFVPGRILDVSKRAAQLLGFRKTGVAQVRVDVLAEDSIRLKEKMLGIPEDTSSMIDNYGGEGDDAEKEEFRESFQDNEVEYFPLYEDEGNNKKFVPEFVNTGSVYIKAAQNREDALSQKTAEQKLKDAIDQDAVSEAYSRRDAFNNAQEQEYAKKVEQSLLGPVPVGYVAAPQVEYIPNPYVAYQGQYVQQQPVLVQSVQPVQLSGYQDDHVVVHDIKPITRPMPDPNLVIPDVGVGSNSKYKVVGSRKSVKKAVSSAKRYYVQAASFSREENADKLKSKISKTIDNVFVVKANVNGKSYYRVQIGPVADKSSAEAVAFRIKAYGIKSSTILTNK
ncbi:MAG: septal ring lytic transglycosylase RlpA family protein [Alphaproteobacteria bacterium]|nr:septal ring lytic transglycosylase RlpA family protein [Alphaproteobacteria bacterium]